MSNGDIKFEFDSTQRPQYKPANSRIALLIMKYSGGLIKNTKQSNYVILLFIICSAVFSIALVLSTINTKIPVPIQYREDISAEVRMKLPPGVFETIPSKFK